ncbi:hypothetical protein [Promicromonospora sp. NPDC057488]|uniref:hypothetical protein n=1 Tax=Promicromonospora sp. NPDC057488 TaxID=3346147 RepID=UPI00367073BB
MTLPRARFDIDVDGHLTVTVDGQLWQPSSNDPTRPALGTVRLGRRDVPWARQQVANDLDTPIRVETVDRGRSRTDIVLPDGYQSTDPDRPEATGEGSGPYAPGEPVVVSVVIDHTHADEHGQVHYGLPAALGNRAVLVHGEISGTTLPLDLSPLPEPPTDAVQAPSRSSFMSRNRNARQSQPRSSTTPRPAEDAPAPARRDAPDHGLGSL